MAAWWIKLGIVPERIEVSTNNRSKVQGVFTGADSYSQRNIPMLLRRILIPFSLQHLESLD